MSKSSSALVAALLSLHCGNNPVRPSDIDGPPGVRGGGSTRFDVSNFVAGVSASDGSVGGKRSGQVPPPSGGPSAQPSANGNVINGGSTQARVRSGSPFQVVYVFVGGMAGGVDGFWEARLSRPTTEVTLFLTLARSLPAGAFDVGYAVATASGAVGAPSSVPARVLAASTGEVQVSVSWDAPSDVDLHVVDPRGEEIYYGHTVSASGGRLDLDSNAGCAIDNQNNENIRWPAGRAPSGSYTVRVDYWDACGVAATNYIVTVNNGGATQTYRGTFTGRGDSGGPGSGRTVATFTHTAGAFTAAAAPALRVLVPSPSALEKLRRATGAHP